MNTSMEVTSTRVALAINPVPEPAINPAQVVTLARAINPGPAVMPARATSHKP